MRKERDENEEDAQDRKPSKYLLSDRLSSKVIHRERKATSPEAKDRWRETG